MSTESIDAVASGHGHEGRREPVLLISYLFPPFGGVAVQRPLSYARYLPATGHDVHVVTASNAATALRDPSLVSAVPRETRIHGTFTPELPFRWREWIWSRMTAGAAGPANAAATPQDGGGSASGWKTGARDAIQRLVSPDPQVVWVPWATRRALQVIRKFGIRKVLVSAPPFSSLEIGVRLKRAIPELTLVSEFRDEWIRHYLSMDRGVSPAKIEDAKRREREVVAASDLVVAVTDAQRGFIASRHPDQPAAKFLCVPNGYDPESFRGVESRSAAVAKRPRLIVTYLGTAYANALYSPLSFLEAASGLPEELRRQTEIRFIGRVVDTLVPAMDGADVAVRRLGFLPQRDAFRYLAETDLLLLIVNSHDSQAGKLFEYLATGKPVLAITPPGGEVAGLLERTNVGWVRDASDRDGIRDLLVNLHEQLQRSDGQTLINPDWAEIRRYERPQLVRQFVEAAGWRVN